MDFTAFKQQFEHIKVIENENSVSNTPLVSVCVQTYRQEKYIQQCLESIAAQQCNFNYEILIGEDDSDDETRNICIDFANNHPDKVRLFLHHRKNNIKINGSPTSRFNYMYNIFSARGKYIAMCEGDDYWIDEQKLQKQVDFLENNPDYSICFSKTKELLKNGKLINERVKVPSQTTTAVDLAFQNYIHTPSIVYRNIWRNQELPDFFVKLMVGDFPKNLMVANTGKIYQHKDAMAVYRRDVGIFSSTGTEKRNKAEIEQFGPFMNYFKDKKIKQQLARRYVHLFQQLQPLISEQESRELLSKSFELFTDEDKNKVLAQFIQKNNQLELARKNEWSYKARHLLYRGIHFLKRKLK